MNQLLERLRRDFGNEDNRYAYADSATNAFVSAQIKSLKEKRGLTQEKLAELIGTQQSGISRLLRADYAAWNIETLRKLARAFGVRLSIRFEEFGTLLPDISGFNEERLTPRKFEEDPVFFPTVAQRETEEATATRIPPQRQGHTLPTVGRLADGDHRDNLTLVVPKERSHNLGAHTDPPTQQNDHLRFAGAR